MENGAVESAYQALDETAKVHVRRILLRLAYLDDALRPRWHSVPRSDLETADPGREDAFLVLEQAGIVRVHGEDGAQEQRVSIVSESLPDMWPSLRVWVDGNRTELLARDRVADAAAAWDAAGRHDADLWSRSRLAIAAPFLDGKGDVELPGRLSHEFLDASVERGQRAGAHILRRRQSVIAGACVLLLVGVGTWVATGSSGSGTAQKAGWSQQLVSDAETLSDSPTVAEQLALAAYRYSPSQAATDLLYQLFSQPSERTVANTGASVLRVSAALNAPLVAASSENAGYRIWTITGHGTAVLDATVRDAPNSALALSPDGTTLAAACHPRGLCLWNVTDVKHPAIEGFLTDPESSTHGTGLTSIAFSPSGTLLAAAGENGKTYVWSVRQPAQPRLVAVLPNPMSFDDPLAGVALSARGNLLAETMQGGETRLWNLKDPSHPALTATIDTGFQTVAFSPDGGMLAAAGDTRVGLWSLADPTRPDPIDIENACTTGTSGSVLDLRAIAFSPGGDQVAYSGQDTTDSQATVCILSLSSANLDSDSPTAVSIPTNFASTCLTYASTGELLTGGSDGSIRQWSAPLQQIDGLAPASHGSTFDVSSDGRLLAGVLSGPSFEPVGVGVWDLSTPSGPVADAVIPVDAEDVAFLSPRLLLTATGTGQLRLWDLTNPRHPSEGASLGRAVIPAAEGWSYGGEVTTNAAGTLVGVLGPDDALHLWHISSAYDVRQLSIIPADGAGEGPAGILPDGRTALLVTSTGIQWWGIANPSHPVRGGFTALPGVATGELGGAGGAGSLIVVGSSPGDGSHAVIDLVNTDNGTVNSAETLTASGYYAFGISDDGSLLATTGNGGKSLTLWSIRDPARPLRLARLSVQRAENIEFSTSDTTMAVIGKDSVQMWSLRDPKAPVLQGTFTPPPTGLRDGQDLFEEEFAASGTLFIEDLTAVYLVSGNSAGLAERLCSSLGSGLTPAQWSQYAPGVPYLDPCTQ